MPWPDTVRLIAQLPILGDEMNSATPTHDESQQPDPFMSLKHGGVEFYIVRHADALPDADEVIEWRV